MKRVFLLFGPMLAIFVAAAAFAADEHVHAGSDALLGKPGNPAKVQRSVPIKMSDAMRFSPDKITVRKGETVRFVVTNSGQQSHEFMLGDAAMLRAHAAQMKKFPDMQHSGPHQVRVEPGTTATLVWQFPRAGVIGFACLVAGHFEAGMHGTIAVR